MAGRQTADIVFCIDTSTSMDSAIQGVKNNVKALVKSLESDLQNSWDVRVDFLANSSLGNGRLTLQTVNCKGKDVLDEVYKGGLQGSNLFTKDLDKFIAEVDSLNTICDEANILALDIATDFPFRDASNCHRAIILMTDENVDGGDFVGLSRSKINELAKKLQEKRIALYLITPDCDVYDFLSQCDKAEWTVTEDFDKLDFTKLLQSIGKSISVSQTAAVSKRDDRPKPLFNESSWKRSTNVPSSIVSSTVLVTDSEDQ